MLPLENWRIWKLNFFSSCLYHEILAFLPLLGLNSSWSYWLSSHYHCLPRQISLVFPLFRVLHLNLYLPHLLGVLLEEKIPFLPFLRSYWLSQSGLKLAVQSITDQSVLVPGVTDQHVTHSAQSFSAFKKGWMRDVFIKYVLLN